jgi:hypothetical protein
MEHKPWLSLTDEDPPERGFAELMAAARAKAEVMAHPPWWKRIADLLKRPPVLALATVIVLIGGVIVVHRDAAEVASPAASPSPPAENMRGASPPPAVEAAPGGAGAAPAPIGEAVATPPLEPPPAVEHGTARPERIEGASVAGKKQKAAAANVDAKLARPDTTRADTGSVEVDLVSKGQAEEAPVVEGVMKDPAAQTRTSEDEPKAQLTRKPAPAASLARCRAAATNKDCAGARACAKQIESESPAFYRANVANDATLKPCL